MKRHATLCLSLLLSLSASACGSIWDVPGEIAGKVYVIVPEEKSSSFTVYLASVVQKHGMNPNLGQATDDKGHRLYVLDATSPSVRLTSQNVPLSGHEDPEQCGIYSEPHPDPGQYFISVAPSNQRTDPRDSRDLLAKIVEYLEADGYDIRRQAIICSEQSRTASKG